MNDFIPAAASVAATTLSTDTAPNRSAVYVQEHGSCLRLIGPATRSGIAGPLNRVALHVHHDCGADGRRCVGSDHPCALTVGFRPFGTFD
jgi:hypothetical protein